MDKGTLYGILIFAAICVVIFVVMQVREKKNKQQAETGEDKARLKSVADRLFANIPDCRSLYGHYEEVQYYGRSKRTTYYRYLLAHDSTRLWIAPLDFQQGSIIPAQPIQVTKDDLGKVDLTVRTAKDGTVTRVEFALFDKTGKLIVQLWASAENLRESSYYPVNINQEEECARFSRFMTELANQVNAENRTLQDEMLRSSNKNAGRGAVIMAVGGIFLGILIPLVGIIMGAVAIFMAPKKEENFGKTPASRVMGIICICTSVIFAIVQAIYML